MAIKNILKDHKKEDEKGFGLADKLVTRSVSLING